MKGEAPEVSATYKTTSWSWIVDGHPMQDIEGGIVNFVKWPGWFLSSGHPLG